MRILAFDQHLDSADLFRNREHKMKEAILPCLAVHTADFYLTRLSECKLLHKTEMAFGLVMRQESMPQILLTDLCDQPSQPSC